MAITIGRGQQISNLAAQSLDTMTQSTATTSQTVSVKHDVVTLGMGTATGFGLNKYLLSTATARELQEITVQSAATGEAKLIMTGTATGALIYGADGDLSRLKLVNGTWFVQQTVGATLATATE